MVKLSHWRIEQKVAAQEGEDRPALIMFLSSNRDTAGFKAIKWFTLTGLLVSVEWMMFYWAVQEVITARIKHIQDI